MRTNGVQASREHSRADHVSGPAPPSPQKQKGAGKLTWGSLGLILLGGGIVFPYLLIGTGIQLARGQFPLP